MKVAGFALLAGVIVAVAIGAVRLSQMSLAEIIFMGRTPFAFETDDGLIAKYLCKSGADALSRAEQAHAAFNTRFTQIIDSFASQLTDDALADNGNAPTETMEAEVETLINAIEAEYGCLAYDFVDT